MNLSKILSKDNFISGEEIAAKLKVSRAAVHKHIDSLRKTGYAIEGKKNLGYKIISSPDLIDPDELKTGIVSRVVYKTECASTQLMAKELADKGAPEGVLVVAEKQTGGYGRLQRKWESPRGGIWFSLLVRPQIEPERTPQITLIASLSISRAIDKLYGVKPAIKWPNDILIGSKKLCGILTEMSAEVGRTNWAVIGAGINANNVLPASVKNIATSIALCAKTHIERTQLLREIINEFSKDYKLFIKEGFKPFRREYMGRLYYMDKPVRVSMRDHVIKGIARSIDTDGYLIIERNGKNEKIISGDVFLG